MYSSVFQQTGYLVLEAWVKDKVSSDHSRVHQVPGPRAQSLFVLLAAKAWRFPIWLRPLWMCATWISTLFWKQLILEASIVLFMSFNESVRDLNSKEFRSPPSARHLICNKIAVSLEIKSVRFSFSTQGCPEAELACRTISRASSSHRRLMSVG